MQRLLIEHVTEYAFETEVTLLPHRLLLRPRDSHCVRIASSELHISPTAKLSWQRDALDNSVVTATFAQPARSLRIASSVRIEHYEVAPLDFMVEEHALRYPFEYQVAEARVLAPFRVPSWPADGTAVDRWLDRLGLRRGSFETFALIDRMNRAVQRDFRYQTREAAGVQAPAQTLALGSGSCRDFAALLMEGCRVFGLASRFVSGYLYAPGLPEAEGATHAWCEAYIPGPGWKGFDPTTGEVTGASHIPVAVAYHPEDVPPVAGSFVGSQQQPKMTVSVRVSTA
jgi:transglutaminase-like putative cysteine protease